MYTWTNKEENEAWEANYAECCKHKWTIEKWVKINGSWKRTVYFRIYEFRRKFCKSTIKVTFYKRNGGTNS